MPQAAQHHGDHQVQVAPHGAAAVAAQRDIQVVAQEARQGHVPAAPELRDIARFIRRIEVQRQAHAEQARQADGHVGISGEVEIQLEGVRQNPAPGDQQRGGGRVIEQRRRIWADIVGNQHFFCQADEKDGAADGDIPGREAKDAPVRELRHHFLVVQYGAGNQMGEVRDKQQIVDKTAFLRLAPIGIDQKSDLGERKKRDPDGQHHVQGGQWLRQQLRQAGNNKPRIFVIGEQAQVGGNGRHQQALAMDAAFWPKQGCAAVVEDDRAEQQRQIAVIPPAIEEQRCHRQPGGRS